MAQALIDHKYAQYVSPVLVMLIDEKGWGLILGGYSIYILVANSKKTV